MSLSQDKLTRANLDYSEELYQTYLKDPSQVEDSWRWFFQGLNQAMGQKTTSADSLEKELKVFKLLNFYREHGSLKAKLNPLGVNTNKGFPSLSDFNLTEKDLNKVFFVSEELFSLSKPLKEVIHFLEESYCSSLALKVSACHPSVKKWFFNEFENKNFVLSKEDKKQSFKKLAQAEGLENFIQFHFLGKKRFSLEGLDVLIPMLDYLLKKGTAKGMKNLVIGMSHRGRLNVLVNILKQKPQVLFSEFKGYSKESIFDKDPITWDVKYHMGYSSKRETPHGDCDVYLAYNPSHLEAISPVVCGVSRAIQRSNQDTKNRKSAVPVLLHGDAAFCGQGVVSETLQLSKLKGYKTGGSLHIILNNQLGFTTEPEEGRSSLFASDLAQSIKAPVLLVNADDMLACLKSIDIAFRFRQEFGQDVFIDLIGYRRYGHNEGDEPRFTQPVMYNKIKNHPSLLTQYKKILIQENVLSEKNLDQIIQTENFYLEDELKKLESNKSSISKKDYLGYIKIKPKKKLKDTKLKKEFLDSALSLVSENPLQIKLNSKLKKILQKRQKNISDNKLDWAMCELLAYASLIEDGFSVRLTGQDSKRGTFSHRHAVYYDFENNKPFSPLKQFAKQKGQEFCIYNSPLSEMAVLGFEYGNSCLAPDFLTLWEAQFGDFVNGAQIIVDQFISSGELKWSQKTDLVLLLPHAYEGQGPEHSSAYLERFLQLCAQDNMRVCNFTKASNLFHALRRQKTADRKPLIIMTPKSLLRHPEVYATKEELLEGEFEELIWDKNISQPRNIENLILCSGKVYFDLKNAFSKKEFKSKKERTALFRLEQLYPFPEGALNPALNGFPCLSKIIWFQEEPKNRGAWFYVKDKLETLLNKLGQNLEIHYEGRSAMASSSEGSEKAHKMIQEKIIESFLSRI
ncbi:MAG: 2-oxoglutarate dehydrogenase E1 component [Bdellovibrionaceae bacterium]|nr:2-oxoglutarate dehydrogenase E1 component [Pseudobdellovibrionaceae bacterium]